MSSGGAEAADGMNAVAEGYSHLVLALGQHDPDYVDAFYGPTEWKAQAEKEKKSLDAIGAEAAKLNATLAKTADAGTSGDEMPAGQFCDHLRFRAVKGNQTRMRCALDVLHQFAQTQPHRATPGRD